MLKIMIRCAGVLLAMFVLAFCSSCGDGVISPPVRLSFRDSIGPWGGKVLQVKNVSSGHTLKCTMHVRNFGRNESTTYDFTLSPDSMDEIGVLETGWRFLKGEVGYISAAGFVGIVPFVVP